MKNKFKIWILQTGEPLFCDGKDIRPMRAINLASKLKKSGHIVEIISSQFYHQKKIHRKIKDNIENSRHSLVKESLIWSPGYRKNIGLMRFIDHFVLSVNLFFSLFFKLIQEKPDLIYIGYPPVDWSFSTLIISKIFSVKTVLEVSDLWPDLFFEKTDNLVARKIIKLIFTPYTIMAGFCAKAADRVCSPTIDMAQYFFNKYGSTPKDKEYIFETPLVPPTNLLSTYDKYFFEKPYSEGLNILFFGSLMSIYDFHTVSIALNELKEFNINLKIIGNGGSYKSILETFKQVKNVEFTGWLDYQEIIKLRPKFDLAIAPYKNITNYKLNIPNKIIDYLSLGLPLLCPLDGCVKRLIIEDKIGIYYKNQDPNDLITILKKFVLDKNSIFEMSKNALETYNKKFKYETVYNNLEKRIISLIEN